MYSLFFLLTACDVFLDKSPTENMVALSFDDGRSFWIDRYEFPNREGHLPKASTTFEEAKQSCAEQDKRLCTAAEWRRACLGPTGTNRFGYGLLYQEGLCHLSTALPSGHSSMMEPDKQLQMSGQKKRCQTPEGVFDLIGNAEEWVLDDWHGIPAALEGGAWYTYHQYADCSGRYSRQPDYHITIDRKILSAGFRCCWSQTPPRDEDIRSDAQTRLQSVSSSPSSVTYDPENEVPIGEDTFIDRYEYPNRLGERPQTAIDWRTASALCQKSNKRLCESYEWEAACSTGSLYPYGDRYDPAICAIMSKRLSKSGHFTACRSPNGAMDMVGNAWEWTNTPMEAAALQNGSSVTRREIRGGSWFAEQRKGSCTASDGYPAAREDQAFPDVGFRCCRGSLYKRPAKEKPTGTCPDQMVPGENYCIDIYEYPNQKGVTPKTHITLEQAISICKSQDKRLCTESEWEQACMGIQQSKWPYGDQYRSGLCADSGDRSQEVVEGAQPSGSKERCTNEIGAYDMSGNLWEWVIRDMDSSQGVLKGGGHNFSAGLGQCKSKATAESDYQAREVGVRCCTASK